MAMVRLLGSGVRNTAARSGCRGWCAKQFAAQGLEARRQRDQLKRVVFVKEGDKVRMQPVETGIADNTHIEVKSGVKAGDEVVSGSYAAISRRLKDGAKVQLEKPKKDEEKK